MTNDFFFEADDIVYISRKTTLRKTTNSIFEKICTSTSLIKIYQYSTDRERRIFLEAR